MLPVLVLPGLAWGAAGRLRPVEYPADWLAARRLINADPRPGRALLLPWGAYRRFSWNHDEAVLDPWPRLLARQVVWNDGVQVGSLQIPPEDPSAIAINGLALGSGPLTSELRARGYRYVIVDARSGLGPGPVRRLNGRRSAARSQPAASIRSAPGCPAAGSCWPGPDVVVYQVPS